MGIDNKASRRVSKVGISRTLILAKEKRILIRVNSRICNARTAMICEILLILKFE